MNIWRTIAESHADGKPLAVATLVGASGSSPQQAGARVVFHANGTVIGTIGGGCMEAEAQKAALECLRLKTTKLFDLKLDDDFGWDDGLICGGSVSIFVDALTANFAGAYAEVLKAQAAREPIVLVIALSEDCAGITTICNADGTLRFGMSPISGGALATQCQNALRLGRPIRKVVEDVDVYFEPIRPRPTLIVAGAGHIGAGIAQVGALCGFEVVVVDDRPSFANASRLPWADRVEVALVPDFFRDYPIDLDTYICIVTRGHRNDAQVLREVIHSSARYIGMIGSKRKIVVIFEEMIRMNLATAEELRRVRSPMGLTLNDREVGEIAVSILAEITAVRNGADLETIRSRQFIPPDIRAPILEP